MTHFGKRSEILTYHQISVILLFAYKLSYKKYKLVKQRAIGSLFRRQQLIKARGAQICTPPIVGLNEFDNSYARLWCESFSSAQSNTRNIECVIGWLKKIGLVQLLFE